MTKYKQDKGLYRCDWFTEWFRGMLKKKEMNLETFSKLTGLGCTTVHNYSTGVRSPGLKTFLMILDKLGLEIQIVEKGGAEENERC